MLSSKTPQIESSRRIKNDEEIASRREPEVVTKDEKKDAGWSERDWTDEANKRTVMGDHVQTLITQDQIPS